jgi:hypothetical protein
LGSAVIGFLQARIDTFFGRGAAAVTVPSMDGALRPNSLLDAASLICQVKAPDNLTQAGDEILFSSGAAVCLLPEGSGVPREKLRFSQPVGSMAWSAGTLAVGLPGAIRFVGGKYDGRDLPELGGLPVRCPTAMMFERPGVLVVCLGSQENPPDEWKRDLLLGNSSGSVWRIDLASNSTENLASGLGYPCGVIARENSELWVSEAWRHRVLRLKTKSSVEPLIEHLPAYPSRFSSASDGAAWLTFFAPRRQMVEFVLREKGYRDRMMAEVDPEYWMAPALSSGRSFLEPIQGGQVKHLGIVKPWGPTRSYGLVAHIDSDGGPTASLHSRADGKRHGITSCLELGGRLLVASKGGDALLDVDLSSLERD